MNIRKLEVIIVADKQKQKTAPKCGMNTTKKNGFTCEICKLK